MSTVTRREFYALPAGATATLLADPSTVVSDVTFAKSEGATGRTRWVSTDGRTLTAANLYGYVRISLAQLAGGAK